MNDWKLEQALKGIEHEINNVNWLNRDNYANFLAQSYYFVCHSVPLLCASSARFSENNNTLRNRFISHMSEEQNHQILALRDLKKMGLDISSFKESVATKMLYEPQYYKINYQNPIYLMGYIIFLEAAATKFGRSILNEIDKTDFATANSFLRVHADEDEEHVEKAIMLINSLPKEDQEAIWDVCLQTGMAYKNFLNELSDKDLILEKVA